MLWLGSYVCKDCSQEHLVSSGGFSFCYIKDLYNEQWDDYQLRSPALGGNEELFALMKDYGVENMTIS